MPATQLCVCYYRLGDYQKAFEYNELAESFEPSSPLVAHNRNFLAHYVNVDAITTNNDR